MDLVVSKTRSLAVSISLIWMYSKAVLPVSFFTKSPKQLAERCSCSAKKATDVRPLVLRLFYLQNSTWPRRTLRKNTHNCQKTTHEFFYTESIQTGNLKIDGSSNSFLFYESFSITYSQSKIENVSGLKEALRKIDKAVSY